MVVIFGAQGSISKRQLTGSFQVNPCRVFLTPLHAAERLHAEMFALAITEVLNFGSF